jgi:hypothetical protein
MLIPRVVVPVVVTGVAVATGYLVVASPQAALGFVLVAAAVTALAAPAARWVAAALVATLLFKGLVELGLLPSTATFFDMFLAWGALAAALLRNRRLPRSAAWPLWFLAGLAVCAFVSGAINGTEALRPFVYFFLLGTPFAIVAALVVDQPDARDRRLVRGLLVLALLTQIPVAFAQAALLGADDVQGTLIRAGAGAHVISAITLVGALWILLASPQRLWLRIAMASPLLLIPFLADAKQVILATPAMVIAGNWRGKRDVALRGFAVAVAVAALLTVVPAGGTAKGFIERSRAGQGGKEAAAATVFEALKRDPASFVLGVGPAESVSRAAFMTTPLLLHEDSPLHALGLEPAELAAKAQTNAEDASGGGTSFNTGISSALGVLGDLGILGALVYTCMIGYLFVALRRSRQREAVPATCALALFVVLGLVFDWWEQPPFGIVVGLLVGLALAQSPEPRKSPALGAGDALSQRRSRFDPWRTAPE